MADLRGKRLLVTGGSNIADDIFEFTKPRGIQVIATGNSHNALMDRADETYSVDTRDEEALKKLCVDAKIDGIFAGGNEPNIVTAIRVTKALGMPYYCNMEQWNQLMNKDRFKSLCRRFGVPITPEYEIATLADAERADIPYPVVVKPVDSCGSNGVIYCENREEMVAAVKDALRFSASGRVIVEKYITGDEISAAYTICHGKITLSLLHEKYPVAEQTGLRNIPNLFLLPSKHLARYKKTVNEQVIAMLKSTGLQFGTIFIQGFANSEGIYMFEAGLRPGGSSMFRYTQMMNNVNYLHILLEHALTGDVDDDPNERDNPDFDRICSAFTLCSPGGHVAHIRGLEKIEGIPQLHFIDRFYAEGDDIPFGTTLAQRVLRFHLQTESVDELRRVIHLIEDNVTVTDEKENSILFSRFDTKRLD